MINLSTVRKWKITQLKQFDFASDMNKIIRKRTLDLAMVKRKKEFIEKMQDLLFEYQDVTDGSENMLYDFYCHYEIELCKAIKAEEKND